MFTNILLAKASRMAEPSIRVDGTTRLEGKRDGYRGDHDRVHQGNQSDTGHNDQFYLERKCSSKRVY